MGSEGKREKNGRRNDKKECEREDRPAGGRGPATSNMYLCLGFALIRAKIGINLEN